MNSFGTLFRVSIIGESHGRCVGAVIDGVPAGVPLAPEDFEADLSRRKPGAKGTSPRVESDLPMLMTGVFNGTTTGAPLTVLFENQNVDSTAYNQAKNTPRPGHADFVAQQKFGGFNDHRGSGHFSGRLTAALVAAGVIAKKVVAPVQIDAVLIEAGGSKEIGAAVEDALAAGDSIGGIVEVRTRHLSSGCGEPFFDSVESMIAHAIFAIPAIKGIEFGAGFGAARLRGSECNDEIVDLKGTTATNNAGGINGGISNGNDLLFRIAVKPPSSISKEGRTIDMQSGAQTTISVKGRHDACIALRVPPVAEAVTAIVIADLMLREQQIRRVRNH